MTKHLILWNDTNLHLLSHKSTQKTRRQMTLMISWLLPVFFSQKIPFLIPVFRFFNCCTPNRAMMFLHWWEFTFKHEINSFAHKCMERTLKFKKKYYFHLCHWLYINYHKKTWKSRIQTTIYIARCCMVDTFWDLVSII